MQFQGQYSSDLALVSAFVALSAIPAILFYLFRRTTNRSRFDGWRTQRLIGLSSGDVVLYIDITTFPFHSGDICVENEKVVFDAGICRDLSITDLSLSSSYGCMSTFLTLKRVES